jgi:hypothetical protein
MFKDTTASECRLCAVLLRFCFGRGQARSEGWVCWEWVDGTCP